MAADGGGRKKRRGEVWGGTTQRAGAWCEGGSGCGDKGQGAPSKKDAGFKRKGVSVDCVCVRVCVFVCVRLRARVRVRLSVCLTPHPLPL